VINARWMFASLLLLPVATHAAGMKIEPGKWEFRSKSNLPMMLGQPPKVTTQCLSVGEVSPDSFLKDVQIEGCAVVESRADAASLHWKVSCKQPGGVFTGTADFTSTGAAMRGVLKVVLPIAGQTLDFAQEWEGRRLGACQ
jgi:hypothetical protein